MRDYIPRQLEINGELPEVVVKQYDNLSRWLCVQIFDGDLTTDESAPPFKLTGCEARLYMQDESGEDIAYLDGQIPDEREGMVTFLLTNGLTQKAGEYQCEIWLTNAEEQSSISTNPFKLTVNPSIRNSAAIEATSSFTALDNALHDVKILQLSVNNLTAMVNQNEISTGTMESEVVDIRVGADGVTYASAGNAVRRQYEKLSAAMDTKGMLLRDALTSDSEPPQNNGIYFISSASKPSWYPYNGGLLLNYYGTATSRWYQMAVSYDSGEVSTRRHQSGDTWSEWVALMDNGNIQTAIHTAIETAGKNALNIVKDVLGNRYDVIDNNLFDGNYRSGISLQGTDAFTIIADSSFHSLAVVPIEPNATYTAIVADGGAESNGYYYFKAATVATETDDDSALIGAENIRMFNRTVGYTQLVEFTTPANATYLLVQASKTKQPFLQIIKGSYADFTVSDYTSDKYHIEPLKDLHIQYVSDTEYRIDFGKYNVRLYRTISESADQDNWNLGRICYGDTVVVTQGTDILGPIKIQGDSDFLSGVHGSSTTTDLHVYCDGMEVTLGSSLDADCDKIVIMMTDACRSEAAQVHVFDRFVTIEITKNNIHVMNTYRCVADSVVVNRATNGGLIAVRNNILVSTAMNNRMLTQPPVTQQNNSSRRNIRAVFNTRFGSIAVQNILGCEQDTYCGFYAVFVNENPIRTKSYFDVIAENSNVTVSNGDEIAGEFAYLFT